MIAQEQEIDRIVSAYESSARGDTLPPLDSFLPHEGHPLRARVLEELVRVDMEFRWARAERPRLDGYLARFPEINREPAKSGLAFEEYRLRLRGGEQPTKGEYQTRYGVDVRNWPVGAQETSLPRKTAVAPDPSSADDPTRIVQVSPSKGEEPVDASRRLRAIEKAMAEAVFPTVGDEFLDFRLTRELGRGSFGRVYLAEQRDLSNRLMAVKLAPDLGGEIRNLARLQHTNIVPIYSTHRTDSLQAIGMPYFGSHTLDSLLKAMKPADLVGSGRWVADLVATSVGPDGDGPDGVRQLRNGSYVDAVLWIGERLADALAHAHERGIIHHDIKPANVLLADDGQPMLLDFNLSRDVADAVAMKAHIGGTLPYMAPEQLRAFRSKSPVSAGEVVDLYALGVVLFQMLTLRQPYSTYNGTLADILPRMVADRELAPPTLRDLNPTVTPAVEAIVRKRLAADPTQRYASAADLRDDLARQRSHRPLKFAAEPSASERVRKWTRRNRWLTSPPALAGYAAALLLAGSAVVVQVSLAARANRQEADRQAALHKFDEFLVRADRVRQTAGVAADWANVIRQADEALAEYDAATGDWERHPDVLRLPAVERDRLRGEIGEIAFHSARASALLKRGTDEVGRLNALAAATLDPTAKSAAEAQRQTFAAGRPEPGPVGDGSRSDFLWAMDVAARGRHRSALPLVVGYLAKHPEDFGGWYLKARCHDALGQYEEARAAYSTCAALRPQLARTYVARGELAFRHGKQLDQALADLNRALQLDPNFTDARFSKALVLSAMRRNAEALEELNILDTDGTVPIRVFSVRARIRALTGDKAGAAADRARVQNSQPADADSFITRGKLRMAAEPAAALADFEAATRLDPFSNEALLNQAHLLGEKLNRVAEALAVTEQLLAMNPDHPMARGGRAVYLARLGRDKDAIAAVQNCLTGNPPASLYYHAACVYAILAKRDAQHRDRGVQLVARALREGFGHEYVTTDTDLDPLRSDSRFQKLTAGIAVMNDLGTLPRP